MTWTETHERTRIVREVEAFAAKDPHGGLPWKPEYAPYFRTPAGLLLFLRRRWEITCEAQLDPELPEKELAKRYVTLRRRNAGILRVLAANADLFPAAVGRRVRVSTFS